MYKDIEAVAFDIDGTLYPSWKLYIRMPLYILSHIKLYLHFNKTRNTVDKAVAKLEKDYPDIQIAEIAENHDDEFESYAITKRILESCPDIEALFFSAAGVCGGCRAVIESRKRVKVVTFDEVPTTMQMLRDGVISVTIGQQPFRQGAKALDIIFDYLTSGRVPEADECIIDLTMKIRENII